MRVRKNIELFSNNSDRQNLQQNKLATGLDLAKVVRHLATVSNNKIAINVQISEISVKFVLIVKY